MKAIVNTTYGPPEVLQLKEVEKPTPKSNEVLIKVCATTVNRTDCGFRYGKPLLVRLFSGITKPKHTILGSEFSGIVEEVGKDVKNFTPGDPVFGLSTWKFGTHAEYVCVGEDKSIALKPKNITHQEAAAICDGAMLAMAYMKKTDFRKNPKMLINGASGSIGTAGVQLAKHFGAEVTAVCNTKSMEIVKALGPDFIIDYTKEDFTQNGKLYDVVFDSVGKSSFFKCKKLLNPGGIYFSSELGYLSQNIFLALFSPISRLLPGLQKGKKVLFPIPTDCKKDIELFKELVESGKYKAVIDKVYPLEDFLEAYKYVETGEKIGNVVLAVSTN